MSQIDVLDLGRSQDVRSGLNLIGTVFFVLEWVGPQEVRSRLILIGTAILEFCERPECVADQCIELGRAPGGQICT